MKNAAQGKQVASEFHDQLADLLPRFLTHSPVSFFSAVLASWVDSDTKGVAIKIRQCQKPRPLRMRYVMSKLSACAY